LILTGAALLANVMLLPGCFVTDETIERWADVDTGDEADADADADADTDTP
jgi:hypothetical protein